MAYQKIEILYCNLAANTGRFQLFYDATGTISAYVSVKVAVGTLSTFWCANFARHFWPRMKNSSSVITFLFLCAIGFCFCIQLDAFRRHFSTQLYHYGRQVLVNLVSCFSPHSLAKRIFLSV